MFAVGIPVCSRHRRSHRRLHAITSSRGDIDPEAARTLGQLSVDGERASRRCHHIMLALSRSSRCYTYLRMMVWHVSSHRNSSKMATAMCCRCLPCSARTSTSTPRSRSPSSTPGSGKRNLTACSRTSTPSWVPAPPWHSTGTSGGSELPGQGCLRAAFSSRHGNTLANGAMIGRSALSTAQPCVAQHHQHSRRAGSQVSLADLSAAHVIDVDPRPMRS